jgi:hypothetical protein
MAFFKNFNGKKNKTKMDMAWSKYKISLKNYPF